MMHDYHEQLEGYDPRQIWHDGCAECEARGADPRRGLATIDASRFNRAWIRAAAWAGGYRERFGETGPISEGERELLELLWAIQVMLERCGGWPIGVMPSQVSV